MIDVAELISKIDEAVARGSDFLFAIDFELKNALFIPKPKEQKNILWRVGERSNFEIDGDRKIDKLVPDFLSEQDYNTMFDVIYKGLYRGDSFLTNLTVRTELKGEVSMKDIALGAKSKYLLYVPDKFVSFSPEPFVKIDNEGVISSYPMKGTINACVEDAENILLNDPKECSEHFTIVDLIRADLSRVATNVNVDSFKYIDKLTTINGEILQMSSKITGDLLVEAKQSFGDMLLKLLPAGSISGAPKQPTLKLIREAEKIDRGFYCGVFGYYDGKELESAVLIRYIEQAKGKYYYRSGGGITINSDMKREYEEVKTKVYVTK